MKNGPIAPENTYVWLECNILIKNSKDTKIEIKLQDDSVTTISVHPTLIVEKNDKHYVKVESLANKNKLVYIKLPNPSMQHGHNITVSEKSIIRKI